MCQSVWADMMLLLELSGGEEDQYGDSLIIMGETMTQLADLRYIMLS